MLRQNRRLIVLYYRMSGGCLKFLLRGSDEEEDTGTTAMSGSRCDNNKSGDGSSKNPCKSHSPQSATYGTSSQTSGRSGSKQARSGPTGAISSGHQSRGSNAHATKPTSRTSSGNYCSQGGSTNTGASGFSGYQSGSNTHATKSPSRTSSGNYSHGSSTNTDASGFSGYQSGSNAHAAKHTSRTSSGNYSHGSSTNTGASGFSGYQSGSNAHATKSPLRTSSGNYSHRSSTNTGASGFSGYQSGSNAHATESTSRTSSGNYSHGSSTNTGASGFSGYHSGSNAHATKSPSRTSSGNYSHGSSTNTGASGFSGYQSGSNAHATESTSRTSSGNYSHGSSTNTGASGFSGYQNGSNAHATKSSSRTSSGNYSHRNSTNAGTSGFSGYQNGSNAHATKSTSRTSSGNYSHGSSTNTGTSGFSGYQNGSNAHATKSTSKTSSRNYSHGISADISNPSPNTRNQQSERMPFHMERPTSSSMDQLQKLIIENEQLQKEIKELTNENEDCLQKMEHYKELHQESEKRLQNLQAKLEKQNKQLLSRGKMDAEQLTMNEMDEAQKEDPLITAINIGHREVKEEFETCFRDVRHKLPKSVPFLNSHDLWQHITGCFQVIFEKLQKKIIGVYLDEINKTFKPGEEFQISSDTRKACAYLLSSVRQADIEHKFKQEVRDTIAIEEAKIAEELTEEEKKKLQAKSMEMIDIAWKMLTLNPPLLPYCPQKYCEEMHERHNDTWKVKKGHYYDLVYYRPVVVYADSGYIACKGFVGRKKSESPINCAGASDSEDSENSDFENLGEAQIKRTNCQTYKRNQLNTNGDSVPAYF